MNTKSRQLVEKKQSKIKILFYYFLKKVSTRRNDTKEIWGCAIPRVVEVFRKPLQNTKQLTERAKTRNRQTQTGRWDFPFRIISSEHENWLVQLADETFGWIKKKNVRITNTQNYWSKIKRPTPNKTINTPRPTRARTKRTLQKFTKTPYLWGGTTVDGIDCSGFVQKVFYEWTNVMLNRNSRQQKKYGIRVKQALLRPFDLVFLFHQKSKHSHVGIYLDDKIYHFCLDKHGLSCEPLMELKKRYLYSTARRIFNFPNA